MYLVCVLPPGLRQIQHSQLATFAHQRAARQTWEDLIKWWAEAGDIRYQLLSSAGPGSTCFMSSSNGWTFLVSSVEK